MAGGTGSASNPGDGIPIIGKTGTTDGARHTWIVTVDHEGRDGGLGRQLDRHVSMGDWSYNGTGGRIVRHEIMRNR